MAVRTSPVRAAAQRLSVATLARPLGFAAAGVGLGAAALAVDNATGLVIAVAGATGAQSLLAAVVGASITVTALLFWVRGMLVQLAAGELSPRMLRWYLEDRFLLRSIAFLIGVFAYCATVLLGMPDEVGTPAPALATTLALLLSIAALCSIVVAIINSVHATDISEMLHQITADTLAHIREQLPDVAEPIAGAEPPGRSGDRSGAEPPGRSGDRSGAEPPGRRGDDRLGGGQPPGRRGDDRLGGGQPPLRSGQGDERSPLTRERPDDPERPRANDGRHETVLTARGSGWVTHVDYQALMAGLPAGSDLRLRVSAGSFVLDGSLLGTLSAQATGPTEVAETADELGGHVSIGRRRVMGQDIAFGIRKLVDVAVQAVASGVADATSAHEATNYLGVALLEVLRRELPPTLRRGPDGRVLVVENQPGYADYIAGSFGELRQAATPTSATMISLLRTLGELRDHVGRWGRGERVEALEREMACVLEKARDSDMVASDRAQVEAVARDLGLEAEGRRERAQGTLPV